MARKFGPWACTYTSNHAHDYRITKPNGSPLPVNAPGNDRSEQREIARLIAAAPDLLDVAKMALAVAEYELGKVDQPYFGPSALAEAANAAIAKAEGKAE